MTSLIQYPLVGTVERQTLPPGPFSTAPDSFGRSARTARATGSRRPVRSGVLVVLASAWPWLGLIAIGQVVVARLIPQNKNSFQDEGLYIYMGHRVLDQLSGREPLFEWPGSYFSGAPAFYPVLAALVDHLGGLQAVRDLSLAFVIVTMVATYGLGHQLFGRLAGILGAAAFVVCGSVIYVSQWATFDSLMLMLAALASWLAVAGTRKNGLLAAPIVAIILAASVFAKYAGAMYVPVVAALVVAVGWQQFRWLVVRRALFMVAGAVTIFFFVVMLWGRGLLQGLTQTTTERHILNPSSATHLAGQVGLWIGPWLALAAAAGLLRLSRTPAVVLVLLGGAVLGPLQQIHIGEGTSLRKHVAFGIIFAAPLIGDLFARMIRKHLLLVLVVLAALGGLTAHGMHYGGEFLTAYPDDTRHQEILRQAVAANPGRPILGEQSSAQRYELMSVTDPREWNDTYVFNYRGHSGVRAYQAAISDHYFGVIYLNFTTANSHEIVKMLGDGQGSDRYYHLVAESPGYIHGKQAGSWLVWAPQTKRYTPIR